jgi:ATP-dependent helicase/nuclease subunit A
VDLWPVIEKAESPSRGPGMTRSISCPRRPEVAPCPARSPAEIARLIAGHGRSRRRKGPQRPAAGDFLILVQRRSALFHEIIRACKALGLPIAGADRLKLGGELAVKDLAALLSFLDTPEDDLSLAAVLRSPLLRLVRGAALRAGPGPQAAICGRRCATGRPSETLAFLADMRDQADFLRPYDLIERVLTATTAAAS